jgi:hypothetical protein
MFRNTKRAALTAMWVFLVVTFLNAHVTFVGDEFQTGKTGAPQLSPREILMIQPDFMAEILVTNFDLPKGAIRHVMSARKGTNYREDRTAPPLSCLPDDFNQLLAGRQEIVRRAGHSTVWLFPDAKKYLVIEDLSANSESDNLMGAVVKGVLREHVSFDNVGKEIVAGHECLKIRAVMDGGLKVAFIYVDPNLNNLVVRVEDSGIFFNGIISLRNISLDVPTDLFEVPADFKEIIAEGE